MHSKIWSAASYLPPFFLVMIFVKRRDMLVFFHAKQALITWLVFTFGFGFSLLPGQFFAVGKWPISISAYTLFAFLFIKGLIEAIRGESKYLPIIGEYVHSLSFFKESKPD